MSKLLFIFFLPLYVSTLLYAETMSKKPALIFAAADLQFVFPQIIKEFYIKYPTARVHIQYASSGDLANDILEKRDYHIYFAANTKYPQKVYEAQKSAKKPKIYAQGSLILFVPSVLHLAEKKMTVLNSINIKNITIANAANAPYGIAAVQVLKNSKCPTSMHKIRYSTDAAMAIDNVIWHGDAGFLSKSALYMLPNDRKKEGVDWIEIDKNLYSPIFQAYTISKNGLKNDNAMNFLHFVESETGQKVFQENGYTINE